MTDRRAMTCFAVFNLKTLEKSFPLILKLIKILLMDVKSRLLLKIRSELKLELQVK